MGLVQTVIVCAALGLATGHPIGSWPPFDVWLLKAVGETALCNTSRDPAPFTFISWKISNITIITKSTEFENFTDPEYADRITLHSDGSLELRNLTLDDIGIYTVNITPTEAPQFNKSFGVSVYERVSDVRLSASAADLIENQSSVNLTCSTASGTSLSFTWYNRTYGLPFHTPVFTLTNVSRYDGPFRCGARNMISAASSGPLSLTVSYGPDVKVKAVPLNDIYTEGFKLTLSCTVDSRPEGTNITWTFNSDPLPVSGAKLVLDPLTTEHRGLYSCGAFNSKTMIYKSSPPLNITVEKKKLFVPYEPLSDGALAGISIACLLAAFGSAGLLYYVDKRKRMRAQGR